MTIQPSTNDIRPVKESHIKDIQPIKDEYQRENVQLVMRKLGAASTLKEAARDSKVLPSTPTPNPPHVSLNDVIYHVDYHRATTHTPTNN